MHRLLTSDGKCTWSLIGEAYVSAADRSWAAKYFTKSDNAAPAAAPSDRPTCSRKPPQIAACSTVVHSLEIFRADADRWPPAAARLQVECSGPTPVPNQERIFAQE